MAFRNALLASRVAIYATGRTFEHAREGIAELDLPHPDFWVCELGTRVFDRSGKEIGPDLSRESDTLKKIVPELAGGFGAERCESYSYRVAVRFSGDARRMADVFAAEVARRTTAVSIFTDPDGFGGVSVDVLPSGCDKWTAIQQLPAFRLHPAEVAYFGDAENDLTALDRAKWPVLMPNCTERLKKRLAGKAVHHAPLPGLRGILAMIERLG